MTAFSEFGVMPEIVRAVEDMEWLLPTDVQAEAIPLILGGGDVLMAAETGSGKTGVRAIFLRFLLLCVLLWCPGCCNANIVIPSGILSTSTASGTRNAPSTWGQLCNGKRRWRTSKECTGGTNAYEHTRS